MSTLRKALIVFGCWTFVAVFFATHETAMRAYVGQPEPFLRALSVYGTCAYIWFAFTPLLFRITRRFRLAQPNLIAHIAVHLLASVIFTAVGITLFTAISPFTVYGNPPDPARFYPRLKTLLVFQFHLDLLRYWGFIAVEHTISYYRQFRERELAASQLRADLSEARLEVLKRQLHPHFLFNTLNSISVLMFEDVKLANRMLLRLSDLLRAGLTEDSPHEVSLEHELRFLERYLDIERIRFGERLTVDVDVDPTALGASVPNLILQPLVENAIRYGVASIDRPSTVSIRAAKEGDALRLEVRDDGPGLARNAKRGVGLSNTEARLKQLYGTEQRLDFSAPDGGGLLVRMSIPFRVATV
jgi:two-component system, LytTR family, sensor kinase